MGDRLGGVVHEGQTCGMTRFCTLHQYFFIRTLTAFFVAAGIPGTLARLQTNYRGRFR